MTQGSYGVGTGILLVSCGLRLLYSPVMLMSQVSAHKMQLLAPEMKNYQQSHFLLAAKKEYKEMEALHDQLVALKFRNGVRGSTTLLGLTQAPFVYVFYLTITEMIQKADLFPALRTDGFLWFTDLTLPDPYYALPVMLACSMSLVFHVIPMQRHQKLQQGTEMADAFKMMKYIVFLGIPLTGSFASALTLNWLTISMFQHMLHFCFFSQFGKKMLNLPDVLPGTHLERMVRAT